MNKIYSRNLIMNIYIYTNNSKFPTTNIPIQSIRFELPIQLKFKKLVNRQGEALRYWQQMLCSVFPYSMKNMCIQGS